MFVRSSCFGAALAAVVLLPASCGSFTADPLSPGAPPPEDGGDAADAGPAGDGSGIDVTVSEGSTPPPVVTLAKGYAVLTGIVATETDVFFVEEGTGSVNRVPIGGGTVHPLAMAQAPHSVAFAGGAVYWADVTTYTIGRVDIVTGKITTTPATAAQDHVDVVAVSDHRLFGLVSSNGTTGQVAQFDLDLTPVTADTITGRTNPFDLTANGNTAYWTEGSGPAQIFSAAEGTAVVVPVTASPEDDCQSIVADQAGVYWTRPADKLVRAHLNGAGPITIASGEASPSAIASDGTNVYWTTANNELRRAGHQEGGSSSLFARDFTRVGDGHVHAIAVTNEYVVWLTGDGRVLRANK